MPLVPFVASRLKIKRAAHHVANLEQEFVDYLSKKPIRVTVEVAADERYLDWEMSTEEPIPVEWAPIIGDIAHNLRSSLDLLACDIVRLNGGNDDEVYFPFAHRAADLEKMIKKRKVDRAAPEAVDLIRSLKPYSGPGGNAALRGIHDLNICDKHSAIIPVAGYIKVGMRTAGA